MESVKRVEIIANSQELDKVLRVLNHVGVPGYTVIRNVMGKGQHSTTADDLVDTSTSNIYIICFCPEAVISPMEEELRPILNRFGGICCVSDAMHMRNLKCVE
jgi:nitrogen regulatory protein PII